MMLPLPEGEGRGEGERIVRTPERCDFCNRLPKSEQDRKRWGSSDFDLRASFGLWISDFGFSRISRLEFLPIQSIIERNEGITGSIN